MSAADTYIKQIKNAPILSCKHKNRVTTIEIKVFNKIFVGVSACHNDDLEYYSNLVGGTLAHMRAMKSALEYKIEESRIAFNTLNHIYGGLTFGGSHDRVDPTHKFKLALNRLDNQYHQLVQSKRELNKEIATYIKDLDKAVSIIEKGRAKEVKEK